MKKRGSFICGFFSCFVTMVLIGSSLFFSHAETQKLEFEKSTAPVYINGVEKKLEVYEYKGDTYLRVNDIKSHLGNISIVDANEKGIYIAEKTGLGIFQYKGKKYVDLSCFVDRYGDGNLPHAYDFKFASIYKSSKGVSKTEMKLKINREINTIDPKTKMSLYPEVQYYEYGDIKLKLTELIRICYDNEKFLKEKTVK